MKTVFTDTSSAILLHKAGILTFFSQLFSLVVPPAVQAELIQNHYPDAQIFCDHIHQGRIEVAPLSEPCLGDNLSGFQRLDSGEKETIGLFLFFQTGFLLTDDGMAAKFCLGHGLPFINALLVPKIFWYNGDMTQTDANLLTKQIASLGRYSDRVKTIASGMTRKELSVFLKHP